MKYYLEITKPNGEKIRSEVKNGVVIPVNPGDDVLVLDENGQPAEVSLRPDGDDLNLSFDSGEKVTLDDFYKQEGESDPVTVSLRRPDDLGDYDFNGAEFGSLQIGDDFSLMRFSNVSYKGFDERNVIFDRAAIGSAVGSGAGGGGGGGVGPAGPAQNELPVVIPDQGTTDEDSLVNLDIVANDFDPEGGALTINFLAGVPALVGQPITLPSGATVTLLADGTVDYDPGTVFQGLGDGEAATDQFPYTVVDPDGKMQSSTVTVTINGANDGPTANDDIGLVQENGLLTISPLTNDTDPDTNDSLFISNVDQPALGSVTLNPDNTVTFDPGTDFDDLAEGETTTQTFAYTISDSNGGTDDAQVTITIVGTNDGPVANADFATTAEDTPITNLDILANDTDVDGDALTIAGTPTAANGTVTVNLDGTINYTPNQDFNGTDTINYTITDPSGVTASSTVTVNVTPVNDPPVAVNDVATTDEDTTIFNLPVLGNDSDVDGDALIIIGSPTASNGTVTVNSDGTLNYTPNANYNGPDTINYAISDGNGGTDTATVAVTVNSVNDDPDAVDDAVAGQEDTALTLTNAEIVDPNDTDLEGDTLTIVGVNNPTNGTVSLVGGDVVFTPTANYNGPATFDYMISDGNGGMDTATVTIDVLPVNDLPVANDDVVAGTEDNALTLSNAELVDPNDTDLDGDSLTIIGVNNAGNGTVSMVGGNVIFTPTADYNGPATFDYIISDGNGGTDTATVTVNVAAVNDAPDAVDDTLTGTEDTALTLTNADIVDPNDTDVELDSLTITGVGNPSNGTVALVGGDVVFTPTADYNGPATFDYTISDGNGGIDTATVTVNVGPVNDPPVAVNDAATTNEDTTIFNLPILGNDSDVDGDPLTITGTPTAANGTVTVNADGTINYTPNANYNGTDTINYTISDGNGGTDTATVTVTVNVVNDGPDAVNDIATGTEDTALTLTNADIVDTNDTDVEGDTLTITSVSNPGNGTVSLVGGDVIFTPTADYNGPATFDYTISDGNGGTDTATVTINVGAVNDPPVAGDDVATTDEDTTIFNLPVLSNDSDVDGDPLTIIGSPIAGNGTVTVNSDGTVNYTPNPDYNGTDTINYTISDGNGGTDTATVTVTVNAVNDGPDAVGDIATGTEDTALTLTNADIVDTNDTDVEGDTLTITSVSNPGNGTVSLVGGDVIFTPTADYSGPATFDYTISDGNGGTDTATVTINVGAVNDPPVAANDAAVTDEDTTIFNLPILGNDSDVDGDPLTIIGTPTATNGTVTVNPDGTINYAPNANYNGTDTINYSISDGNGGTDTATVAVTVNSVNDGPNALDDAVAGTEDLALTLTNSDIVDPNDTDLEGDALTIIGVANSTNGTVSLVSGNVIFTPTPDYNGPATFDYTISDGNGGTDTATVTVNVSPVNDGPVAADDTVSGTEDIALTLSNSDLVDPNDTDLDGDALTIVGVNNPSNGTVSMVAGNVIFTPIADYNGPATFNYTISDGNGGTDTATVTVNVAAVNDAPDAVDDTVTGTEDTALTLTSTDIVDPNDNDIEGDTLTITSVSNPSNGSVSLVGGDVVFTPAADYNGPATFDYTISDGNGGTDSATVTINLAPDNDPPVAVNDIATTDEDQTIFNLAVLGNDSDVDNDPLTIIGTPSATNGTITVNGDGTINYTPNANFNGADTISYSISDGNGGIDTATVAVMVNSVNDGPNALDDAVTGTEDLALTLTNSDIVDPNDTDLEGDTLTIIGVTNATNGTVSLVSGDVIFTPTANYNGPATFDYTISDGNGGTDSATVTVNVAQVNDGPVAADDTVSGTEDTALTLGNAEIIDPNDTDLDGDALTIIGVNNPGNGTVSLVGGNVVFTPTADYNGPATFDYTISDGNGGTDTATVTVNVAAVNDAPDAVDDTVAGTEDTALTLTNADIVDPNDTDVELDSLTITGVSNPSNGTVALSGGDVIFTPTADYNGPATFDYTISDGNGGTDTATVTINVGAVNDPPVAANDVATTDEDQTIFNLPVLNNDSDVDGDPLTILGIPTASNGTVTVNVDGTINYAPNPNYNGPDTISYIISDGNGGTDTATVAVTVNSVNDGPSALNDAVSATEDTALTLTNADIVDPNDTDIEGDTLTIIGVNNPSNGAVSLSGGNVVFTPTANYNGPATFDYTISDGNGGTDTATVTINIAAVNDLPVAVDDTNTIAEDTVIPITGDVEINDTDPDGDTLVVGAVEGAAGDVGNAVVSTYGTITINTNGSYAYVLDNSNTTVQTLGVGQSTIDVINYTISDGQGGTDTATLTITITGTNDGPVAVNDTVAGTEDTALTLNTSDLVDPNDTDIDGDTLIIIGVSNPSNGTVILSGGDVIFTPATDYNGPATFDYTISDGNGGTDTATVTVNVVAVNDPPVAVNDSNAIAEDIATVTGNVETNDTDIDGDTLVVGAVEGSAGNVGNAVVSTFGAFTINADGTYLYALDNDNATIQALGVGQSASDVINYTISDGNGGTDTATLTITIAGTNDGPIAVNDAVTGTEDTALTLTNADIVTSNDTDLDGDTLTIIGVNNPTNGTVLLSGADVIFTPSANYNGPASFDYTISDGNGGTDTATVNVTVDPVNDAPLAGNDALGYFENSNSLTGSNLLSNDIDPDPGDSKTIISVNGSGSNVGSAINGVYGNFTINADGSTAFIENAAIDQLNQGQTVVESYTYVVSDGNGATDSATVNLTITGVNDAPNVVSLISNVVIPEPPTISNTPPAPGTATTTSDVDDITVTQIAQNLIGAGVTLVGATLTSGTNNQAGTITGMQTSMPGVTGFDDGIILTTGSVDSIGGPNSEDGLSIYAQQGSYTSNTSDAANDPDLGIVFDLAILRIEFIPTGDTVSGNYVFGSEEYNEYVNQGFNDNTGMVVNGVNVALTPDNQILGIDTINNGVNSALYVDNDIQDTGAPYYTQMDGFTRTLQFSANVNPGVVNILEIKIGDVGDNAWESWLVFEAGSLMSNGVDIDLEAYFDDIDFEDDPTSLTYSATQSNGSALPGWLSVVGNKIVGFAPTDGSVDLAITVTATDSQGATNSTSFNIQSSGNVAPIVIDMDGDGVEFDVASQGINFDIDGDGALEQLAWADEDDAVLIFDANDNNEVDGREEFVFADYSDDPNATDLQGLAEYFDTNQDGILSAEDEEFASFKLWQDIDGDGQVGDGEMITLEEAGIESIELTSDGQTYTAANGDVFVNGEAVVNYADGSTGVAADAVFDYSEIVEDADAIEPLEIITGAGDVVDLSGGNDPVGGVGEDLLEVTEEGSTPLPVDDAFAEGGAPSIPTGTEDDAAAASAAMG